MGSEWYTIDNISELDSPAMVVYSDRVRENIKGVKGMIDDVDRLRPHVKTNKSKEVCKMLMDEGIKKFKCATIAEAEMLGMIRAQDVLLAYQPTGPKLTRFMQLVRKYPTTTYSCLYDNAQSAQDISIAFANQGLRINAYMDVNNGNDRSGIIPGPEAVALYEKVATMKGIVPVGLHVYDGQHRQVDIAERTKACNAAFEAVEKLKTDIQQLGFPEPVILAGGSPTFPVHAQRKDVICCPGTFVYWDKGYSDICSEQPFVPAALVVSRVISLPTKTRVCTDLGHKSIASENILTNRIHFLNAPDLKPVGQSEEHLVLEAGEGHGYKVGDVLYGLPFHICPTVALYERVNTVQNGKANGEWRVIARDRKIEV
jgi:D-threonine aldolase